MIRYSLSCKNRHTFDSWFQDSSAFDRQVKRKLVACPHCGDTRIEKTIMAPQVSDSKRATRRKAVEKALDKSVAADAGATPAVPVPASSDAVTIASPQERELRAKLKELREQIVKNSDHVGARFPEEARKMHYGESEHRSIHGEASLEEARELAEEGIEFYPVPVLPDERN
jgi:hypothetical protein